MFHKLDNATTILYRDGVFRTADIYERFGTLYAKHGAGFVRLHIDGRTSAERVRWADIDGVNWAHSRGRSELELYDTVMSKTAFLPRKKRA
jgi:hypothetical protein